MVYNISASNFEELVLKSNIPVLLTFGGAGCPDCESISLTLERLVADFPGKFSAGKIDARENLDISIQYNVRNIPVTLLMVGGIAKEKIVGNPDKRMIINKIENHVSLE
jgi:thioredoxin 1